MGHSLVKLAVGRANKEVASQEADRQLFRTHQNPGLVVLLAPVLVKVQTPPLLTHSSSNAFTCSLACLLACSLPTSQQ